MSIITTFSWLSGEIQRTETVAKVLISSWKSLKEEFVFLCSMAGRVVSFPLSPFKSRPNLSGGEWKRRSNRLSEKEICHRNFWNSLVHTTQEYPQTFAGNDGRQCPPDTGTCYHGDRYHRLNIVGDIRVQQLKRKITEDFYAGINLGEHGFFPF